MYLECGQQCDLIQSTVIGQPDRPPTSCTLPEGHVSVWHQDESGMRWRQIPTNTPSKASPVVMREFFGTFSEAVGRPAEAIHVDEETETYLYEQSLRDLGERVRAAGLGHVLQSHSDDYREGVDFHEVTVHADPAANEHDPQVLSVRKLNNEGEATSRGHSEAGETDQATQAELAENLDEPRFSIPTITGLEVTPHTRELMLDRHGWAIEFTGTSDKTPVLLWPEHVKIHIRNQAFALSRMPIEWVE